MMNSEQSFKQPEQPTKRHWQAFVFLGLAVVGLLDSAYLTAKHYSGGTINCNILKGCDTVTSSVYSEIFGIPVALFGMIFYLAVIGLAIAHLESKKIAPLQWLAKLTVAGILASTYFTALQAFVINAWCQYCVLSALISLALFILTLPFWKKTS